MKTLNNWTPDDLKSQLDAGANVFLKLWKKGCGACKLSEPAIERIAAEWQPKGLVFGQIQADEHPEIMEIADTDVLPVFFVFKDQEMKGRFIGFKGLAKLEAFVSESMA
jgi:thiol-disulfide isomerase/thioredoxin